MDNKDNISIQKYIAAVYSDGAKCNNQAILNPENENYNNFRNHLNSFGRQNQKLSDSPSDLYRDNIAPGISTGSMEKDNNPVQISKGDYVVYRIHVYNNSTKETTGDWIKIRDRFPSQATLIGVYGSRSDIDRYAPLYVPEYINDDGSVREFKSSNFTWKDQTKFQWKINYSLQPKQYYELLVVVKFNSDSSKVLMNRAWVFDTEEKNVTNYRESDSDYVEFKNYSVSLEKYITWTNNDAETNYVRYYGTEQKRDGHPIYQEEMGSDNKDTYKQTKPALVDSGDRVNYSIKVTNTGKSDITVKEVIDEKASELTYISASAGNNRGCSPNISGNKITFTVWDNGKNGVKLAPGASMWITVTFRVTTKENDKMIQNYAYIDKIWDESGNNEVTDSDGNCWTNKHSNGNCNNEDKDWVKTKKYYVKLEKYISKAYDSSGSMCRFDQDAVQHFRWRYGNAEYGTSCSDSAYDKDYKKNNPVTVQNGDIVTYDIKVTNEGDTQIHLNKIIDKLPEGVQYNIRYGTVKGEIYQEDDDAYWSGNKISNISGISYDKQEITFNEISLSTGQCIVIHLPVKVTEPNISTRILKNTASLPQENNKYIVTNKNGYTVYDYCQNDDEDADYIQLEYGSNQAVIAGKVWNDKALEKTQDHYDGLYNQGDEQLLSGIKVTLIRKTNTGTVLVSSKYTNSSGQYVFYDKDINKFYYDKENKNYTTINYITNAYEQYIKGPRNLTNKKWTGTHYSYYVMFEYDGVTYTSTPDGNSYKEIDDMNEYNNGNYKNNSNAREKLSDTSSFKGYVDNNRTDFNNKFSTINNGSGINYTTKNQLKYIPQSNHNAYNEDGYLLDKYKMQSSTNLIDLNDSKDCETQIRYINLGLRGRDIFDLELTSDVDNVKVTVNNQPGVYNYTNKVTIQRSDLSTQYSHDEDMANTYLEGCTYKGEEQKFSIRKGDIDPINYAKTNTGWNYSKEQGLQEIKVTYKITVTNASKTDGTATKVIDYYDNRFSHDNDKNKVAYYYSSQEDKDNDKKTWIEEENIKDGVSGSRYKSIIITTPGTNITQTKPMEIYVVYTLNSPTTTLADLLNGKDKISTYNMAEIYEYKTKSYEKTSNWAKEFTRGLIDKDSAPGNVIKKEVCLENDKEAWKDTSKSTVNYYFEANNLKQLKYEDDTYATPTLLFTTPSDDSYNRKISGTVFEDYTVIVNTNGEEEVIRTKTGDGKQKDDEPGIKGITVLLVEKGIPRYRYDTDENGYFEFSGLLPGNYTITFAYGNKYDTFLYDNNPNTKSYNGEDFQSTNNKYTVEGANVNILDTTTNYWYAFNKPVGISTAVDREYRRKEVSKNVTAFNDYEMEVLNNARDGKTKEEAKVKYEENGEKKELTVDEIMSKTSMTAETKNMILTVEETVDLSKINNSKDLIKEGKIIDKGNGLGEWAIFPKKDREYYTSYNVSNMNFGIAEVPVTTIDLQKHVKSFIIKDSTGKMIASAEMDNTKSIVTVNPSKIASNRINVIINVLAKDLEIEKETIKNMINYNSEDASQNSDKNIVITENATGEQVNKLQYDMTMYSLSREITITKSWKVTSGNVLAAPGTSVIDVSIEDEKLQGAKLEVTYTISSNIYTEKNFDNKNTTEASITGLVDYIDNDLSYNESLGENSKYWEIIDYNTTLETFKDASFEIDGKTIVRKGGYIDINGEERDARNHTTIIKAKEDNPIITTKNGKSEEVPLTLERTLTAADSSLASIIKSSIDSFEYDNVIEITGLDYGNTVTEETGEFKFRDRIRTPDRYIILAGAQYDYARSEAIAIHPPTGENNNMIYYIIASISIGILSVGIVLIKKYAIKRNDKK